MDNKEERAFLWEESFFLFIYFLHYNIRERRDSYHTFFFFF